MAKNRIIGMTKSGNGSWFGSVNAKNKGSEKSSKTNVIIFLYLLMKFMFLAYQKRNTVLPILVKRYQEIKLGAGRQIRSLK